MSNKDKNLLTAVLEKDNEKLFSDVKCEFPLDKDVIGLLSKLNDNLPDESDDYEIFRFKDQTDHLWSLLLEKAIKCLRYYDTREPFIEHDEKKSPKAYGIKDLKSYYDKYSKFEQVLYGSSKFYRDHVIHVFRTWLTGIVTLTKNEGEYLRHIAIIEKDYHGEINNAEKVSIWTVIALSHDLGYPLEKAKGIIDVTQEMVATFISNPEISKDFSFHGVQNYMNDFVVRLMSSKMKPYDNNSGESCYVARLQPKYYFKFQKSLEKNSHGILSTLIIYKLLTYFLESDYNINEDYTFAKEDCRQFYIRREILRSIAAHTCDDVYQLYMDSFAFLLRICDDTQEWGRKNISELYVNSNQSYRLTDIEMVFSEDNKSNKCIIKEEMKLDNGALHDTILQLIDRFRRQALIYVTIFRDGQDTGNRNFSFERLLEITSDNEVTIKLCLKIDKDEASKLLVETIYKTSTGKTNEKYGYNFFKSYEYADDNSFVLKDDSGEIDINSSKSTSWKSLDFSIKLFN